MPRLPIWPAMWPRCSIGWDACSRTSRLTSPACQLEETSDHQRLLLPQPQNEEKIRLSRASSPYGGPWISLLREGCSGVLPAVPVEGEEVGVAVELSAEPVGGVLLPPRVRTPPSGS